MLFFIFEEVALANDHNEYNLLSILVISCQELFVPNQRTFGFQKTLD